MDLPNHLGLMATILESFVGSCAKKLQDIVTEEAMLILGVKEELIELQRRMEQIRYFLNDAEQRSIKESAVTNWLGQLRDAMYEADDMPNPKEASYCEAILHHYQAVQIHAVPLPFPLAFLVFRHVMRLLPRLKT